MCDNTYKLARQNQPITSCLVSLLELTLFHPLTRVQVAVLSWCLQHDNRPRPLGAPT